MRTVFIKATLPGWLSLDGLDELVEKVREKAFPVLTGRNLTVTWEAETDWELRGLVQDTLDEVESGFQIALYGGNDLDALMPQDA